MGSQGSKLLTTSTYKKKGQKSKRRISSSTTSQGDYDWLEHDLQSNKDNTIIPVAVTIEQDGLKSTTLTSPNVTKFNTGTRRQSISEFFARRKQSIISLHPIIAEEDRKEYDRLQRQHYLLKSTRKGNFCAPIESPKVIVEAGTGSGIWALEIAAQYTDCQVLGLDLKPPAFQHGNPTNLRYSQTNLNESWPMNDNSIDFIFQRNMYLNIKKDQWFAILAEMFRVLKPGGYIELLEPDFWHHNTGPTLETFVHFFQEQCAKLEVDMDLADSLAKSIEEQGFEQVEKRILDIPIGEWSSEPESKQYGFINKEIQRALLKNRKAEFITRWGVTSSEYDESVINILDEYEEYKSFSRFNCWIAKKPLLSQE